MKGELSWLVIFESEFRLKHKPLFWPFVILLEYYRAFLTSGGVIVDVTFDVNGLKKFILISADRLNKEDVGHLIKVSDYLFKIDISLIEKRIWIISIYAIEH